MRELFDAISRRLSLLIGKVGVCGSVQEIPYGRMWLGHVDLVDSCPELNIERGVT